MAVTSHDARIIAVSVLGEDALPDAPEPIGQSAFTPAQQEVLAALETRVNNLRAMLLEVRAWGFWDRLLWIVGLR